MSQTRKATPAPEPRLSGRSPLKERLLALKLSRIADIIEEELDAFAIGAFDIDTLLLRLLDAQLADRAERRIERCIRESHLPERKTLLEFNFDFQPELDRRMILELTTCRYIEKRLGVILAGNSGTGKSHIAKALALEACKHGVSVLYTTASAMLTDLYAGLADNSLEERLKGYIRPALLVIDEIGFDRLEQENARNAALFFKVVEGRYQRASTIYTTNIDFEALGHYLGDPVVTTAIVDRMVHRSTVITLSGRSWRLKESQELNHLAREGLETPAVLPEAPAPRKNARTRKATA